VITGRPHEFPSHILRDHIRQSVFLKGFKPPVVPNPAMVAARTEEPVAQTAANVRS
jgi:hypothetical protein